MDEFEDLVDIDKPLNDGDVYDTDHYWDDVDYCEFENMMGQLQNDMYNTNHFGHEDGPEAYAAELWEDEQLAKEALFDNGIDGEPFAENESQAHSDYEYDDYSESSDVHIAKDLEIKAWPTYGNFTIITNIFHMYLYPGANVLEIFDLRLPNEEFASLHKLVLSLRNIDLYFFGQKNGPEQDDKWNIDFYTGAQVNEKIQRYVNLKAFI